MDEIILVKDLGEVLREETEKEGNTNRKILNQLLW
jgi:hypothetical protein